MSKLTTFTILVDGFAQDSFAAVDTEPNAPADKTRPFEILVDSADWEWDGLVEHAPEDGLWALVRRVVERMDEDEEAAKAAVVDRQDGAGDRAWDAANDWAEGL